MDVADLVGVPFVDRGRDKSGFDCWGLCLEVFKRYGIALPDYQICCSDVTAAFSQFSITSSAWDSHGVDCIPVPAIVAIRFDYRYPDMVTHVGTYIGDGKFIHTREKIGSCVERIDSPAWRHRIAGFYTPPQMEVLT
jgi:cell wall-associated NlpC family hydrolase